MTDQQHPITPPPELVEQWLKERYNALPAYAVNPSEAAFHIATQAARWGSDQELQACCEWLDRNNQWARCDIDELHDARRPKPPSPKEEALQVLEVLIESRRIVDPEYQALRHALEQLND